MVSLLNTTSILPKTALETPQNAPQNPEVFTFTAVNTR